MDLDDSSTKPWTVLASSTLHWNAYFSILQQEVAIEGVGRREYFTIHFPRPAVGVVARRGTDILLIRQYRFIVGEYVWAVPSGGVAEGETLQAAAAREFEEETGYKARTLRPLMGCYASYGCSNQRFEIFVADDVVPASGRFDESEVMGVRWFSRQEVLELVLRNGIVDNLSLSPILLALLEDTLPCPL
jgi:ADP-ribose pyrophosphatase